MIWVDAHLSPGLARWINTQFDHPAQPVRDLGRREAKDAAIFGAARQEGIVILEKALRAGVRRGGRRRPEAIYG
jgi:predicted nuclease of predicted toxin-antitoxin system